MFSLRLKFLCFFLFVISIPKLYANNIILQSKELVFLHFDNDSYLIGEDIFFKVYVVNSCATKSAVLYVELISPDGYIVEKKKYRINDGCCDGHFELLRKYEEGVYEVRAYTRYMLNWGDNLIFKKRIPVYNRSQKESYFAVQTANETCTVKDNNVARSIVPLQFTVNKESFKPYEKIAITISRKDGKAISESAKISVSVKCKEQNIAHINEDNISGYLAQKMQNDTLVVSRQMYKPEKRLIIDGYLFKKEKWYNDIIGAYKLLPQSNVYIDVNGVFKIKTDENGFFEASFDDFYGEKIIELAPVLPKRKKKDNYAISLRKHIPIINTAKISDRVKEFNFFDEWEYAQDVTFLAIDSRSYLLNNYDRDFYKIDYKKYRPSSLYYYNAGVFSPEQISPSTLEENGAELHNIILPHNSTPGVTYKEQFERRLKNIDRSEDIMTAQKVLLSALWRHGYSWCDWMKMQVLQHKMLIDSVKEFTCKYTEERDAAKMMSFEKIVVTDDNGVTEKFAYEPMAIKQEFKKLKKKKAFAQYYDGFLNIFRVPNIYNSNINANGYPGVKMLHKREIPSAPDFVSFFVPDTVPQNIELIKNILSNKEKRYTKLQGFSETKVFSAPDYSSAADVNISDNRRTLLWVPTAKVVEDGNIYIELYNNSHTNSVEVEVNGVDNGGIYF